MLILYDFIDLFFVVILCKSRQSKQLSDIFLHFINRSVCHLSDLKLMNIYSLRREQRSSADSAHLRSSEQGMI